MRLAPDEARRRAAGADHGILATIRADGEPAAVPACFAIDGEFVAIPIDTVKPKASTRLGRVRNLDAHPRASLLLERWDAADWSRLWWVRLDLERVENIGPASPTMSKLARGLRERYPQYRDSPFAAVLTFRILAVAGWEATSGST